MTSALDDARYVALTTYRRDGSPVPTTVWIAPLADRWVVITQAGSHKAGRLRSDPRVAVSPSDWRGRVSAGAPVYRGTARFLDGDEREVALGAVRSKYGIAARAWPLLSRIVNTLRRRRRRDRAVIELSLTEGGAV